MVATFSNARNAALPCERMRGCVFADNFVTMTAMEELNAAVDTGTGNSVDHGLTTDGNGHIEYDATTLTDFTVTLKFTKSTAIANLLTDGDSELSGVASWTAGGGTSILTKETITPYEGTQWLKVERNDSNSAAYQNVIASGCNYSIRGYSQGDGTAIPQIGGGSFTTITLNNTTVWDAIDEHVTSAGTYLYFGTGYGTDGNWVGFDNLSVMPKEILACSNNLIEGVAANGWCIWLDEDGIKASYSDGTTIPATPATYDFDYADGVEHTVTFTVDADTGGGTTSLGTLHVDDATSVTCTADDYATLGSGNICVAGDGGNNYIGSLNSVRVFNNVLTAAEHANYYNDTLTSFFDSPTAAYRCDSFSDDTDGDKIWDKTTSLNDLYKADRVTTANYPAFQTDKYFFDAVNDYVDNMPTFAASYTVTAATSTPQLSFPEVKQHNDTTLTADLTTSGAHWGYLHSMAIHPTALTQLQLYHDEYKHLYYLDRGRASGMYHRLITEGTCKVAMFLDSDYYVFYNYARGVKSGYGSGGVTRDGSNGCDFVAAGGVIIPHDSNLILNEGTIAIKLDFESAPSAAATLIDHGANYKIELGAPAGLRIALNGSLLIASASTCSHIAISFRDGFKPRVYVDGVFDGEGSTNYTYATTSEDLVIGNSNEFADNIHCSIKQVYIGDRALTDSEIKALYEESRIIGAASMETGTRVRSRDSSAVAVDVDVDPGGPFQMIAVEMDWSTGDPTTSEDVVITTINSDGDAMTVYSFDPSVDGVLEDDDTIVVWLGGRRYDDGTTIAVDYANTDTETVICNVIYQLDESVT
ncbi:MAG: LamG domain-containing protein [Proteobacteria bacterium]|nr:LamG domain-containing protein [Pseudomonadota bacterium]